MNVRPIAHAIAHRVRKRMTDLSNLLTPPVTRGPELVGTPVGTGWSVTGTGASVVSGALVFTNASNLAAGFLSIPTTEDNVTYEVIYTVTGKGTSDSTTGKHRAIVYGNTTAHAGVTTDGLANGTFTQQVTTSAAGSSLHQIRIQATGTTGTNNFSVTLVSVKKVLA